MITISATLKIAINIDTLLAGVAIVAFSVRNGRPNLVVRSGILLKLGEWPNSQLTFEYYSCLALGRCNIHTGISM